MMVPSEYVIMGFESLLDGLKQRRALTIKLEETIWELRQNEEDLIRTLMKSIQQVKDLDKE